jgi:hypothetical protein
MSWFPELEQSLQGTLELEGASEGCSFNPEFLDSDSNLEDAFKPKLLSKKLSRKAARSTRSKPMARTRLAADRSKPRKQPTSKERASRKEKEKEKQHEHPISTKERAAFKERAASRKEKEKEKDKRGQDKGPGEESETWFTPFHQFWLNKPAQLTDEELEALTPNSDTEQ